MNQYRSELDMFELWEVAKGLNYSCDAGQIEMACSQSEAVPEWLPMSIKIAINEIAKLRNGKPIHVMVNIVKPGSKVPPHTDLLPENVKGLKTERWHLAIKTNDQCFWWDIENGRIHFPEKTWNGPVNHQIQHTFFNEGTTERLHLVVDLLMRG